MKCFSDPHHVTSSERDHARSTFKAHTSTDRVVSLCFKYWLLFCTIHLFYVIVNSVDMENNNDRTECEFIIFWIVLGYLHTF